MVLLGLGRVELSSVKAIKVTGRPTAGCQQSQSSVSKPKRPLSVQHGSRMTDLLVCYSGASRGMQREGVDGFEGDGGGG